MRVLFSVCLAVAMVGCSIQKEEQHFGFVECAGADQGYLCTLTHQQGSRPFKMCWTLNITCANGVATASTACGEVAPLGRSTVLMPFAQIPKWDQCDSVVSASIMDTKVTAR